MKENNYKRKCKCGTDMTPRGYYGSGLFWCPNCGTISQSYVCEETSWKIPNIYKTTLLDVKNINAEVDKILVKYKRKENN